MRVLRIGWIVGLLCPVAWAEQKPAETVEYTAVHAVLAQHCLACHDSKEKKGRLVLETHESLLKGGKAGHSVVAGDPEASELFKRIVTDDEIDLMPPPDKGRRLNATEVALIRDWIKQGAAGPLPGQALPSAPVVLPKVLPRVVPRNGVFSLASIEASKLLAVGRHGEIELRSIETRQIVRKLEGVSGNVNALAVSPDGALLAAAGGVPGVSGWVAIWTIADGKIVRTMQGHADTIYSLAISGDGKLLATGSYDQKIILWSLTEGSQVATLSGHNGCVYALAFRPDGRVLASSSADRTVKLWSVPEGKRLDTLVESTRDLYALAVSPDGTRLAAGGVDNRIRLWQFSPQAMEGTNTLLHSRYAHEGAILKLAYSPDGRHILSTAEDRTVKLWNAADATQVWDLKSESQSDWPTAACFTMGGQAVAVGRLDGSLAFYAIADGKVLPPPAPVANAIEPRGVQSGTKTRIKLTGDKLLGLADVKSNHPGIVARPVVEGATLDTVWVEVEIGSDVPPGAYQLTAHNEGAASGAVRVDVDNIPQVSEVESPNAIEVPSLAAIWGVIQSPGDVDAFTFEAQAGQVIVLDLATQRIGSKLDGVLTLTDGSGRTLAYNKDYEVGSREPLIAYTVPEAGRYSVRVGDFNLGGSPEFFYRLSIGPLPMVTGVFPQFVPANKPSKVWLAGYNLPTPSEIELPAKAKGNINVPLDPVRFRVRKPFAVHVGMAHEAHEPQGVSAQAEAIPVPGAVNGRISAPGEMDDYTFTARAGQVVVIETQAARVGSPIDTKIEVLDSDGQPVPRLLLRAVRDSWLNFRPMNSVALGTRLEHWQEMKLNDYIYFNGEVARLFRQPRGPDSDNLLYASAGKRKTYFDTSATDHALEEPAYVVEPHPLGSTFPPNGLPIFTVYHANDDDGDRELGRDSRITFTAPTEGTYRVRVSETQGLGGDRYTYRLILRDAAPDFSVRMNGLNNPSIPAGSAREFTVVANRVDGFDGPIAVTLEGLPPGFTASNPIVIEAGHDRATGTLYASPDAPQPTAENQGQARFVATATLAGHPVTKPVNGFGNIQLAEKPQLLVDLLPEHGDAAMPLEITIAPGQEVPAVLRVERNGFKGLVTFEVENLPHGMIVSDIGLNGVLIPEDQSERRVFLACDDWVAEQDRLVYAKAQQGGNPTSRPVLIKVRKPAQQAKQ